MFKWANLTVNLYKKQLYDIHLKTINHIKNYFKGNVYIFTVRFPIDIQNSSFTKSKTIAKPKLYVKAARRSMMIWTQKYKMHQLWLQNIQILKSWNLLDILMSLMKPKIAPEVWNRDRVFNRSRKIVIYFLLIFGNFI